MYIDRVVRAQHAAPSHAPPGSHPRDRGVTFVETVLTVVLLGIVVVPVLAAVRGAITTSSVAESAAQVETVLINAADRVERAPNTDIDACDFTGYAAAALPDGWPVGSIQVGHEYLADGSWVTGSAYPACPDTGNVGRFAKRITITATSPDGAVTRRIQVVKSDV